jgi:hypothetical protein
MKLLKNIQITSIHSISILRLWEEGLYRASRLRMFNPSYLYVYILALCCLLLSSCTLDAVFVIDVSAATSFTDRDDVRRLEVTLRNVEQESVLLFPEDGPSLVEFPTDFSFSVPKEREGLVNISIEALDKDDVVIATGSGSAIIALGERTRLEVRLFPVTP